MELYKNKVFKLLGKVQGYAWGGTSYIPHLLHLDNAEKKPFAEYWMGAHDNAPSGLVVENGQLIKLNEYLHAFPEQTLGAPSASRFGRLPYLLKILDVKDMLSIQVHPSKTNAEKEFADEHGKGVPLHAPHRNYKDDNHKPELMYALSEFWLLHGFKPEAALIDILNRISELQFLVPVFQTGGYRQLYKSVMEMEQQEINKVLEPLLQNVIPAYQENKLEKNDENFWAARAALTYNQGNNVDRGIFSIYFFNLLNLHPGESVFQDAGLPHAYLEGQNVEIMANSDNVLRGGLTPKHVDVQELLKHIKFEATIPDILTGKKNGENSLAFPTPAPDFELGKIVLAKGMSLPVISASTEIFIIMEGSVELMEQGQKSMTFQSGESWVGFYEAAFVVKATKDAVIFWAGVPGEGKS